MWILYVVVLTSSVLYCTAQDEDLLIYASPNCKLSSTKEGLCVKSSQCSVTPPMPDPATLFTIRSLDRSTQPNTNQCDWTTICCPTEKVINKNEEGYQIQLGCGYSNPGGTSLRNSFGNKATYSEYAEFPWMVALMLKKDIPGKKNQAEYIGGGTLIHPSVVMTVAHKVYEAQPIELKCRAGEWNWSIDNELNKHQEKNVASIIVNENFDKIYIYYDVALLALSSPFDLANAPHIGVGCLAPTLPMSGTICYSMGWGKDINNNNKSSEILKKLQLPLVRNNVCENLIKNTRIGRRYKLHKSLTCAGGEAGVDTCQGDGGSPLVCRIPDPERLRYTVVGMVAYGVDCGMENVPGVYAKVPEFYDWNTVNPVNGVYQGPTNSSQSHIKEVRIEAPTIAVRARCSLGEARWMFYILAENVLTASPAWSNGPDRWYSGL